MTLPVQLVTATESHAVEFHQYQRGTADRIRHLRVNERTGDEVGNYDIVKGRTIDGKVITVEDAELDAIAPGRSRSIAIACFVDVGEIDPIYLARTYWLVPGTSDHQRPYTLLHQAMTTTGRAAIATFVLRGREHLAVIRAVPSALALTTLRFADEVRDPATIVDTRGAGEQPSDEEVQAAISVITAMSGVWKPSEYHDSYTLRVEQLLQTKANGATALPSAKPPDPTSTSDLERALRDSLTQARNPQTPSPGQSAERRHSGRAES